MNQNDIRIFSYGSLLNHKIITFTLIVSFISRKWVYNQEKISFKGQTLRANSIIKPHCSHMSRSLTVLWYFSRFNLDTIRQAYGMTEMSLTVTRIPPGVYRPGSSGKVVPLVSGKVRDPETGRSLGPNQIGELCWKVHSFILKSNLVLWLVNL